MMSKIRKYFAYVPKREFIFFAIYFIMMCNNTRYINKLTLNTGYLM